MTIWRHWLHLFLPFFPQNHAERKDRRLQTGQRRTRKMLHSLCVCISSTNVFVNPSIKFCLSRELFWIDLHNAVLKKYGIYIHNITNIQNVSMTQKSILLCLNHSKRWETFVWQISLYKACQLQYLRPNYSKSAQKVHTILHIWDHLEILFPCVQILSCCSLLGANWLFQATTH